MGRLVVGTGFVEDARTDDGGTGWWSQRLAWFARPGDVMVLPVEPDQDYLSYVGELTGVDPASWRVVVAPPGEGANNVLTSERLGSDALRDALLAVLRHHPVDEVFTPWPDRAVARLTDRLGLRSIHAGRGFLEQSGGHLMVSKATFRAVAAGNGVPIPPGAVIGTAADAVDITDRLLREHEVVMLKQEWGLGGRGNDILSTVDGVRPLGAPRVVRINGRADLERYFAEHWSWLSSEDRSTPVAEQYFPDSAAYFIEFAISDDGVRRVCDGEQLNAPLPAGFVLPAPAMPPSARAVLDETGLRLAEVARAMGYRGYFGPDGILTADQEPMYTEWNGRMGGVTHVMEGVGRRVVGPAYQRDRVILDLVWTSGWSASSFEDVRERVARAGLGYDRERREGVVLTTPFAELTGVMYCVVAADADRAWEINGRLAELFSPVALPA
ncbi:peptide ligase PGM1-related protein [Lentzea alba]|uniref:preATP grasp domain-containing protein n=1 Tax=Lentzea alba TaxID=2714351 RepID=UPI0039BFC851